MMDHIMDLGAHSLSLTPHGSLLLIHDDDAQRLDTHFKGTDPTGARRRKASITVVSTGEQCSVKLE